MNYEDTIRKAVVAVICCACFGCINYRQAGAHDITVIIQKSEAEINLHTERMSSDQVADGGSPTLSPDASVEVPLLP